MPALTRAMQSLNALKEDKKPNTNADGPPPETNADPTPLKPAASNKIAVTKVPSSLLVQTPTPKHSETMKQYTYLMEKHQKTLSFSMQPDKRQDTIIPYPAVALERELTAKSKSKEGKLVTMPANPISDAQLPASISIPLPDRISSPCTLEKEKIETWTHTIQPTLNQTSTSFPQPPMSTFTPHLASTTKAQQTESKDWGPTDTTGAQKTNANGPPRDIAAVRPALSTSDSQLFTSGFSLSSSPPVPALKKPQTCAMAESMASIESDSSENQAARTSYLLLSTCRAVKDGALQRSSVKKRKRPEGAGKQCKRLKINILGDKTNPITEKDLEEWEKERNVQNNSADLGTKDKPIDVEAWDFT